MVVLNVNPETPSVHQIVKNALKFCSIAAKFPTCVWPFCEQYGRVSFNVNVTLRKLNNMLTSQLQQWLIRKPELFLQPLVPFHATVFLLYPLETTEYQRFCDVFSGYRKRSVEWNGLKQKNDIWIWQMQRHWNYIWDALRDLVPFAVLKTWKTPMEEC